MKGVKSILGCAFFKPTTISTMAKNLTERVGKLESEQAKVLANQEVILEERVERKEQFKEFNKTLGNIDRQVNKIVTEVTGDNGYFKLILENKGNIALGKVKLNKTETLFIRVLIVIVPISMAMGWLFGEMMKRKEEKKSEYKSTILYHKPFEYGKLTKIL